MLPLALLYAVSVIVAFLARQRNASLDTTS
jgi:hypothetical protein